MVEFRKFSHSGLENGPYWYSSSVENEGTGRKMWNINGRKGEKWQLCGSSNRREEERSICDGWRTRRRRMPLLSTTVAVWVVRGAANAAAEMRQGVVTPPVLCCLYDFISQSNIFMHVWNRVFIFVENFFTKYIVVQRLKKSPASFFDFKAKKGFFDVRTVTNIFTYEHFFE